MIRPDKALIDTIHGLPPEHVHMICQGSVTAGALVALGMHAIGDWLEAGAWCGVGILGFWIGDIERELRHPGLLARRKLEESAKCSN